MIFTSLVITLSFGFILIQTDSDPIILLILCPIILIIISFTTLTVAINENYLRIKFGYGIFSKRFNLNEISAAKTVKNHWYYGWGIRLWLRPRTWIFNVSGFDAVEIIMKSGKKYRIGTDEPEKLEEAILQSISS